MTVKPIVVKPILETLDYIKTYSSSVVRFGDGEVDLMMGNSIPYQVYDQGLAERLKKILAIPSSPDFLVCLPDVFDKIDRYTQSARYFWTDHFQKYSNFYNEQCNSPWYGSTFLSRPYIDLVDRKQSEQYFSAIKNMWKGRSILIVEGELSRSGVGNDLFSDATSIERIICPSKNAYQQYDEILKAVEKHAENKLILLMLGPTAKVLSYDLYQKGYQVIDIGHIDSEYEWFQMRATHKTKLLHKHTAEFNYDTDIVLQHDEEYQRQIIARVAVFGAEKPEKKQETLNQMISVIVPVYNVKQYLKRCVHSLLKQTYSNFEIILVNDGSTDGSGQLCQELSEIDQRIRVFHQENTGVSQARNFAIKQSRGAYLTFVDSDDFVDEDYLKKLYTALVANQSDISICNFTSFNEERQSYLFYIRKDDFFEKNYTVQEWMDQETVQRYNLFLVFCFSPMKLFKRELFEGIFYPNYRVREDDATIYKVYLKAKKITYINDGMYFYSQRSDGLSRTAMQDDIVTMISNAEERIALMVALGYDASKHITSYIGRLKKCQQDALATGQINLYQQITTKLQLYQEHQRKGE